MRIRSSVIRRGVLRGLALGVLVLAPRTASADLTLFESDGWSFFTDGRINSFYSLGYGNDFPQPTFNPNMGVDGMAPQHVLIGANGEQFSAGFPTDQGYPNASGTKSTYIGERIRSGFLGSIIAFGMKRQLTPWTSATSYVSLWGTSEAFARDRTQDSGKSTSKGFDVREGWVKIEGLWGNLVAGKQSGILGGISTEIDYLYGHGFGVGLPCLEIYYPTCGHIGTGVLGPGFAAGFTYTTPSLGGLRVKAGLYDPVRLLGVWERVPYPRPEGAITYENRLAPNFLLKLQVEGMYQYMAQLASRPEDVRADKVWGVAAGGRIEYGVLRVGGAFFQGKGLGSFIALQNATSTFNGGTRELRYFTGMYAQTAVVFGREQLAAGAGRVVDHQLGSDKINAGVSNLKSHTGFSFAFYHHATENLVLGLDYFFFRADWWGAPNSTNVADADGNIVAQILPGYLTPENQVVHFINAGATFHW